MNRIKVSEVECLYCRTKGFCITDSDLIETVDDIIVRPIICTKCNKNWKDFYGDKNATSVLLQIQRNTSSDSSVPTAKEGDN